MIPRYEYLVTVWELNEPVQKIQYLILRPVFRDVSAMNKHITFREILQMVVLAVGVGVLAKLVIMVHMVSGLIIRNG